MGAEDLELLVTIVVEAADEQEARTACERLVGRVGGAVVGVRDCSDEEPGCWALAVRVPSDEKTTHSVNGALARAVRTFVRGLGDEYPTPRVQCEPPVAWTVLDEGDLIDGLVPGAERILVEAWAGDEAF
jgi:hypothetical protein